MDDETRAEFSKLRNRVEKRHRQNLRRFRALEITAVKLNAQLRLIIALLLANGIINLVGQVH